MTETHESQTCASTGLEMTEYDDYGWPEEHRERVAAIMNRWSWAGCDLQQAAREMLELAAEVEKEQVSDSS